jgi:hypothetical protein
MKPSAPIHCPPAAIDAKRCAGHLNHKGQHLVQVMRIEEIVPGLIDIAAKDRDRSARIFVTGYPGADFSVAEWTQMTLIAAVFRTISAKGTARRGSSATSIPAGASSGGWDYCVMVRSRVPRETIAP